MNSKIELPDDGKPRQKAEGTVFFSVSAFPRDQWNEWNLDCQKNFGDCRWIKMWSDHLKAKDSEKFSFLERKIIELENKLNGMMSKPVEKEEEYVQTFTGKIKKGG